MKPEKTTPEAGAAHYKPCRFWSGWRLCGLLGLGVLLVLVPSLFSIPYTTSVSQLGGGQIHAASKDRLFCDKPEKVYAHFGYRPKALPTQESLNLVGEHLKDARKLKQYTAMTVSYDKASNTLCAASLQGLVAIFPPAATTNNTSDTGQDHPWWEWIVEALKGVLRFFLAIIVNVLLLILDWLNFWKVLVSTDATLTYDVPLIQALNVWSAGVGGAALVLLLVLTAYRILLGQVEDGKETFVRLVLSLVMMYGSFFFVRQLIDLHNALCSGLLAASGQANFSNPPAVDILKGSLSEVIKYLAQIIVLVLLGAQLLVRLALLDALIAVAPLAMLCFAFPPLESWGRKWVELFLATLLMQFFQLLCVALGGGLVDYIKGQPLLHQPLGILLSIASFYLALQVPQLLNFELGKALRGISASTSVAAIAGTMGVLGVTARGIWNTPEQSRRAYQNVKDRYDRYRHP